MTIQLGKKQISDWKYKTIIVVAVLVFWGFLVLGVMLGGTDSTESNHTESNQKVAYRVCEKYSGTRCDILDPKDWRKLSNGFSVRGPRFENIHDPRNVRQYPDWFLVEKININAYK